MEPEYDYGDILIRRVANGWLVATGSEIDGALTCIDYVCMCVKRLSTFADSGNHGDAGDHRIARNAGNTPYLRHCCRRMTV